MRTLPAFRAPFYAIVPYVIRPPPERGMSVADCFRAKGIECFERAQRAQDNEFRRLYYDLAIEWLALAAEMDARVTQPPLLSVSLEPRYHPPKCSSIEATLPPTDKIGGNQPAREPRRSYQQALILLRIDPNWRQSAYYRR